MAHKNIKSAYTDTQSAEQSNRKTKRLSVLHAVQQKAASSFHLQHTHMFLKQCGRTFHSVTNIALHGHLLLTKICLQHRLFKKKHTHTQKKTKRGWGKFWIKRLLLHQSFNNLFISGTLFFLQSKQGSVKAWFIDSFFSVVSLCSRQYCAILLYYKNSPCNLKHSLLLKSQSFVHLFSFKGDFVDLFVDLFEFI